jgi:exopolysaccharide biosynthesis polyprenyl glycosylphosphotransferase
VATEVSLVGGRQDQVQGAPHLSLADAASSLSLGLPGVGEFSPRRPASDFWTVTALAALDGWAFAVAWLIMSSLDRGAGVARLGRGSGTVASEYATMLLLLSAWLLVLAWSGAYGRCARHFGAREVRRIILGGLTLVAVLAVGSVILPHVLLVRPTLPFQIAATVVIAWALRAGRAAVLRAGGRVVDPRRLLVVGAQGTAEGLARHLYRHPECGLAVAAVYTSHMESPALPEVAGGRIDVLTGDRDALVGALYHGTYDAVAVVDPDMLGPGGLRQLRWDLAGRKLELLVVPHAVDVAGPKLRVVAAGGLPLVSVGQARLAGGARAAQAAAERLLALALLIMSSPLLLGIGAVIKATSAGPIFFRQTRVGFGGTPFTLYKFRTMKLGAELALPDLLGANESDGALFKMRRDPRVTPVGRWLRRFSLDEVPQLLNVVTGRMSIVGPRPPLPSEVSRYPDELRRRFLVTPGITGLWQVSGRSALSWEETVRLDLFYVDNRSLALDLFILGKTFQAVVGGRGAY